MEGADAQKVEYGKDPFEDSLDNETKIFRRYMQNCYEENCRRHVSLVLKCNNHLLRFLLIECVCFICY